MQRLTLIAGLVLAALAAAAVFALPQPILDAGATGVGLASVAPSMAPPLGQTARALLALALFAAIAALTLFAARRGHEDIEPYATPSDSMVTHGDLAIDPGRLSFNTPAAVRHDVPETGLSRQVASTEEERRDSALDEALSLVGDVMPAAARDAHPIETTPAWTVVELPVKPAESLPPALPEEASTPSRPEAEPASAMASTAPAATVDITPIADAIARIEADMAALRAAIPAPRDDKDIAAALRAVETVLRKKTVQPVEAMLKKLEAIDARLELLGGRIESASRSTPALPPSDDPEAARRVADALADLRRVLGDA